MTRCPGRRSLDPGSDGQDCADRLNSWDSPAFARRQACEEVGEIDPDDARPDRDLTGPRLGVGHIDDFEYVRAARTGHLNGPHISAPTLVTHGSDK